MTDPDGSIQPARMPVYIYAHEPVPPRVTNARTVYLVRYETTGLVKFPIRKSGNPEWTSILLIDRHDD